MVWLNKWNSCSEIFRKIAVVEFLGRHTWWRSLLPRCAGCTLECYWRPTPSQIFSCILFEISDNSSPTRWRTVFSCLLNYHVHCVPILTNINSQMLLNPITYDTHHCQETLISQYLNIGLSDILSHSLSQYTVSSYLETLQIPTMD